MICLLIFILFLAKMVVYSLISMDNKYVEDDIFVYSFPANHINYFTYPGLGQ